MADNNGNGNMNGKIPFVELAKLGAVTVVAVISLWLMSENNKNTVKAITDAINKHDSTSLLGATNQVEAMKELTKAITEWRIEMARTRQTSERIPLN